MRKFNLFSRSALTSMAVAAGLTTLVTDGKKPGEDDQEAGPTPDDGEKTISDESDAVTAPKPAGDKSADDAGAEAAIDVVPLADANAHAVDQFNAGRKAERDRTAAVLGSDVGKANATMAAWMLASTPDAGADAIIAQLGTMPTAALRTAAVGQGIPDTNVDLGKPGAAAALADTGTSDADAIWADVQGTTKNAPVVSSDAGRATLNAIAAGGQTVNVGGTTPSTPAVAPTGN